MIQDIGPHDFNIVFKDEEPDAGSKIIFLSEGKIYVLEKEKVIDFPTYADIDFINQDDLQYLFSMDDDKYFRYHLDGMSDIADMYQNAAGVWKTRHELRQTAPKEQTLVAITAMHLDGWYEKNKFCGACGTRTVYDKEERMMRCPKCNNMIYPRINPAVIVGVTNGDEILLTKYRGREYKNYALVAGFTEIGESFEETVRREVMEEVGVRVKNIRYFASQPWGIANDLLLGYYCELDGDETIHMDEHELKYAQWIRREDIELQPDDYSLTNEMMHRFKQGLEP